MRSGARRHTALTHLGPAKKTQHPVNGTALLGLYALPTDSLVSPRFSPFLKAFFTDLTWINFNTMWYKKTQEFDGLWMRILY
jgi:hypothetical protein